MSQSGPWIEKAISYRVQVQWAISKDWTVAASGFGTHDGATTWAQQAIEEAAGQLTGYAIERETEDGSWKRTAAVEGITP